MVKRVLNDVLIGAVLAFGSQILQYGAYLILLLAGFSMPYESAPSDPGSHPDWVTQINLMSMVAAVPVLVAAFVAAWILKTRSIGEGVRQGLVWAAVAVLWQLMIGIANGTTAALAVPGVWVYFAAFAVGPIIAGWLRQRRARALT